MDIDHRNRATEFGIMIGEKSYWNQGYGNEAVRLLLKLGFETMNLNRVFLRVFETNPRAIRAYEKAGFKREGRQRQGEWQNGRYIDVLVMSVLREEWLKADAKMPELPEVETIARMLRQARLSGEAHPGGRLLWERTLAEPGAEEFAVPYCRAGFPLGGRRGKFLVFSLSRDTLLVHLRMSGDLLVELQTCHQLSITVYA